jgi:hypothetical protein
MPPWYSMYVYESWPTDQRPEPMRSATQPPVPDRGRLGSPQPPQPCKSRTKGDVRHPFPFDGPLAQQAGEPPALPVSR